MASDCTVEIDDGYINLRVGAIIMKNGKFLMVGNQKDNYLYLVGGRIQFGETAEEAVVREGLYLIRIYYRKLNEGFMIWGLV